MWYGNKRQQKVTQDALLLTRIAMGSQLIGSKKYRVKLMRVVGRLNFKKSRRIALNIIAGRRIGLADKYIRWVRSSR